MNKKNIVETAGWGASKSKGDLKVTSIKYVDGNGKAHTSLDKNKNNSISIYISFPD